MQNSGDFGHFLLIISFVSATLSAYSYFFSLKKKDTPEELRWEKNGRIFYILHSATLFSSISLLFYIVYTHKYQFHYAWAHSSNSLPVKYMIACFWEGQEGSFLLWLFWNMVLGFFILGKSKEWEKPVMTLLNLVQVFLLSMLMGVYFGDLKIGSSPFVLLKDVFSTAPIFASNPLYVPQDGNGLNPLLQNYWMVIHPPTLFLGFSLSLIPFAYVISALWLKKQDEWVKPVLTWLLICAAVLGLGIIMGGYWAYETLNFGGYWNWDPVENSSLVPWILVIGAIHALVAYRNTNTRLRSGIILCMAPFLMVLYSTFLTRSGILGNASVHSFTDLGLSGQLLIYMIAFFLVALFVLLFRWKGLTPATGSKESSHLPMTDTKETSTIKSDVKPENSGSSFFAREEWMLMGIIVLLLASFQITLTTSIPVLNKIAELFNFKLQLAPPANLISHYNRWHIVTSVVIAILSGMVQYIWWKKMQGKLLAHLLLKPFIYMVITSIPIILFYPVKEPGLMVLLITGIFSIYANAFILINVLKGNLRIAGGALTHTGFALMLIGILFSAGYSTVISENTSGEDVFSGSGMSEKDKSTANKENVLLHLNQPVEIKNYSVTYKGLLFTSLVYPAYLRNEWLEKTPLPQLKIAKTDIKHNNKIYFKKGKQFEVIPENTYYEVYFSNQKNTFTLYPRAQVNPKMGLIASPDIKHFITKDIYTHVSSIPDYNEQEEWKTGPTIEMKPGDTTVLENFIIVLESINKNPELQTIKLGENDVSAGAQLKLFSQNKIYSLEPVFILKDREILTQDDTNEQAGVKASFREIIPDKGVIRISLFFKKPFKDYIVLKTTKSG